ncbi:hypothetical protein N9W76_00660 [Planktomarina temperata]|nr:hypothetical protein [Planktomarina temperata]
MTHDLNSTFSGDFAGLPIDALLPERPAIIGEFSPAYEAFKTATFSDLEPMNNYEFVLALQLVDLNWAILQRKASADIELSVGIENKIRSELKSKLNREGEREYTRLLRAFKDAGGDEDDFEDPIDWEAISDRVDKLVIELKSADPLTSGKATAEAMTIGVDPRLVLSQQYFENFNFKRHTDRLPNLEKRARQLSAEYREVQKARPIDVVPVSKS